MSKMVSIFLILSLSLNAFAQMPEPKANPPAPKAAMVGPMNLPSAQGQCTFEPQLSKDDKALLESAKNAINTLRQNSKCSAMASQFDAFQEALKAYNQQTGADRVPGYDGNLNVTCANYTSIYDSNFQFFTDNWQDPGTGLSTDDMYFNCRSKTTRDEAVECGALITGRSKNYKKAQCDAQKDAISAQAMGQLLNHSYTTGLEAIQAILNNNDCIDSSGEQKLSFIQSAVGLASRAASLSVLGTGTGLLIGAASQVVGSAIKNFFTSSARNRDHMAILDNRENFTRVACLYEQIESKALRCERVSASLNSEALAKISKQQELVCGDVSEILKASAGVNTIESIMKSLKDQAKASPEKAAELKQEQFDGMIKQLSAKLPDGETTILSAGLASAKDVVANMSTAMADDEALKKYLSKKDEKKEFSGADLRSGKRDLEQTKAVADSVIKVLESILAADGKGTSMDASDMALVQKSMMDFEGGPLNFVGAYNQIMILRATKGDDLSKQIKSYQSKLSESQMFDQLNEFSQTNKLKALNSFDDGGRFVESQAAIRPHLEKIMEREITALSYRAFALKEISPGVPEPALKENLRSQEESVIYPLLRACNQLRSVSNESSKKGLLNVSSETQPSVCQVFNCKNGARSFEDYIAQNKLKDIDPKKCDTECMANYDRYICMQTNTPNLARHAIQNEFLTNATICGKSMAEAFGNVKKKENIIPLPSFGLFKDGK
jgi:hypothetical protein